MDCVDALFALFLSLFTSKLEFFFPKNVTANEPPLLLLISNGELTLAIPQLATSLGQLDYLKYCEYPFCGFTACTRTVPVWRVFVLCLHCKYSCCACAHLFFLSFSVLFSFYPSCCSFLGSIVRSPVRSFLRTLLRPIDRSLVRSFVCPTVRSCLCSIFRAIIRLLVRTFVRPFDRTFVCLSVCSLGLIFV